MIILETQRVHTYWLCHYTFVQTTPKHVGPRGTNCQPELPQTKDITACIGMNKTTVFRLHDQRESNGKEIPIQKHLLLHPADGWTRFGPVYENYCLLVGVADRNAPRGHRLTTHLHLVLRLIMGGAVPPLRRMHLDFFTSPVESCEHRTVWGGLI